MKTEAAVLVETAKPLEIVELEIPALKTGQCLVEVRFSGACHTQLLEARGRRGEDPWLPHCLGHEASGVVLEVGADVSRVRVNERVALSWIKASGIEAGGSVYNWNGMGVNAGAVTTFQRHAVVSENRLTVLPDALAMKEATLLGCALPTGLGAVMNVGKPLAGESVAIFGVGGVGLCAVMGAVVSNCSPVIVIDLIDSKLEMATTFGATHTINASKGDGIAEVMEICPNGVDLSIEATGRPAVMATALTAVRAQGGRAVVIGNAPKGQTIVLDPWQFNQGKSLLGTWGGRYQPLQRFSKIGNFLIKQ
ncbi:MAG: zinc-binding dehydrogenase [Pseudomonadota bacterium]|nr:zinc-binding dehydrogenase [Pseudomonadota bacterium]